MADIIAPFIVGLFNRSLADGNFLAVFTEDFITPIVKRPEPNSSVERSSWNALYASWCGTCLPPISYHSGFRPEHCWNCGVAVTLWHSAIAADRGDVSALVLMDINHSILSVVAAAVNFWYRRHCLSMIRSWTACLAWYRQFVRLYLFGLRRAARIRVRTDLRCSFSLDIG